MSDRFTTRCSSCDRDLECCAFCEEEGCATPVCFECMNVALGQAVSQPHPHGG